MQITAIGTVWRCEADPNNEEHESEPYVVELVEYLPGNITKDGPRGQAVKMTLDVKDPLTEGLTYRVTARITCILPTQSDDDIFMLGTITEATLIE